MSATVETAAVRPARSMEVIIDFEPEKVHAPFFLRCGALLADYIILISIPVIGLLLSRYMGNDGAKLLGGSLNDTAWLIAVLLGFTNFIVLPVFSGQTLGKMLTGLRIVRSDGRLASKGSLILRQTLGYLLSFATLGFGFLLSVFGSRGRALHDYLAGTIVIYADRTTR